MNNYQRRYRQYMTAFKGDNIIPLIVELPRPPVAGSVRALRLHKRISAIIIPFPKDRK